MEHPAKFTDCFIPILFYELQGKVKILDPFAGTGKIGKIKEFGYTGKIYANEIETEWLSENKFNCDVLTFCDAENLPFEDNFFDGICTSPTYGNRMADHHIARDSSKRNTYTHCLGRQLTDGNTGKMQWGNEYCEKHKRIYKELFRVSKKGCKLVINISNHIRKGQEIDVCGWTERTITEIGFSLNKTYSITTNRNRFGKNGDVRVNDEKIFVFIKQ